MLRIPALEIEKPSSLAAACARLHELGDEGMAIAGGTDLVPNLKHELFTPKVLVSLADIPELHGIRREPDGALVIGAMTTLATVSRDPWVRAQAPALAQATGLVAGPQQRNMGTLGGNVMLDTRCQWYNQSYFWRQSLGFCLKKDGSLCHVIAGGKKCVAAASNDSVPALSTLGATLGLQGPTDRRQVPIDEPWKSDGIFNKQIQPGELLTEIRIPAPGVGHRGAYGKLRERGSIDFPLLGVAARLDVDHEGVVGDADVVLIALQARPIRVAAAQELTGIPASGAAFAAAVGRVADAAARRCRALDNIPGDAEYRQAMVPVYVRRTLLAAAEGSGPVHHI